MINALAIETSSRHGSLALGRDGLLLASHSLPEHERHAATLLPAIQQLTTAHHLAPQDLHHLYLSIGPGSFTGLRIAIAAARALAHALPHLKLVAIPSLDLIAHNAPIESTLIAPILDAKRGQVFTALYTRTPNSPLTQLLPPTLLTPQQLLEKAHTLSPNTPLTLLGEGLIYHHFQTSEFTLQPLTLLPRDLWFPRATTLLTLAHQKALREEFTPAQNLLPLYIRLPEAEELWQKKHAPSPSPL